ncbi:Fur family transcriptional regulator [Pectinatus frisingensis]|uniref:Fur family transcriptional regulator n=1 Tax=Pectinatus frisingensis TaxID=865 RepID=UPI0018C6BF61|nr:Fur family transcriptional regulator [Pectinatus frisingensis]
MEELNYKEYLNKYGMKSTKQRNLLLNILKNIKIPHTAEQIYLKARKSDALVNLSTVYRILEKFTEKKITLRTSFMDEKCVYSLFPTTHQHQLICLRCKKVILIGGCPLKEFEKTVEKQTDFSIVNHRLELYGYCRDCQKIIAAN